MYDELARRRNPSRIRGGTRLWLAAALAASTALYGQTGLFASEARAQEAGGPSAPVAFAIPAQPMAAAIDAFIKASGWQVSYPSQAARGRTSSP